MTGSFNRNPDVPPRWACVRLDESSYWSPPLVRQAGGKIFGVYLVDLNARTFACSAAPCYELHYLESVPLSVPDLPESMTDLADTIREEGTWSDPVTYRACSEIDAAIERGEVKVDHYGDPPDDWRDDEHRGLDEVCEHYQGNPAF